MAGPLPMIFRIGLEGQEPGIPMPLEGLIGGFISHLP